MLAGSQIYKVNNFSVFLFPIPRTADQRNTKILPFAETTKIGSEEKQSTTLACFTLTDILRHFELAVRVSADYWPNLLEWTGRHGVDGRSANCERSNQWWMVAYSSSQF
ncbi:hypothetical protein DdX_07809 [Ditylenchus destructor]|uniref:Uncharacterized protein n=1 Tax=Ditylenchus destructor TaxID=166010 RepID=A0AAD4R1C8_9BILA|nr:hypothetical protein DdX_07809 [Ditylenchus destructor]